MKNLMTIRFAVIGAALVLSAPAATAQGAPPKQVILSEAALKSMAASKPKSKTPLASRVGVARRPNVVRAKESEAGPTSVGEIIPKSRKK